MQVLLHGGMLIVVGIRLRQVMPAHSHTHPHTLTLTRIERQAHTQPHMLNHLCSNQCWRLFHTYDYRHRESGPTLGYVEHIGNRNWVRVNNEAAEIGPAPIEPLLPVNYLNLINGVGVHCVWVILPNDTRTYLRIR